MFSSKIKTWMENHIGLPKRKNHQEKEKFSQNGGRGIFLDSSDSLAQSDTGISSGSQQVLSSSATDNKDGYCTTTMESDRSGMTHCHTAISLPSPESAYSTGYSTDGASPGGTGPPEYYINIRTGKHYFPSPAPTPTSPQPNTPFAATAYASPGQRMSSSFLTEDTSLPPVPPYPPRYSVTSSSHVPPYLQNDGSVLTAPPCIKSRIPSSSASHFSNGYSPGLNRFLPPERNLSEGNGMKPNTLSTSVPSHFEIFNFSKSPCKKTPTKSQLSSLKLFLKSPKQDKGKSGKGDPNKTPTLENKKKILSPTKNKKWYKQPFQKFGNRRPDSCEENNIKNEMKKDVYLDKNLFYLKKDTTSSPRQRNRIKTNPWLPTEPMSSQNFHNLQINFSPSLARNRSCTNTPLQNRKTSEMETLQNRIKQMNVKYEESKDYLNNLEKVVNRHMAQKLYLELSDHSEEDLTLNEMMGTYNESYVYEKETDILSDSDPTDCEDYVSDSEADNGGDEQDSHDDELDFIDNGSITESDDNFAGNTGKCTYHDVYVKKNSFLYKSDRHHSRKENSECRRSLKREQESKLRRSKEDKKKRMVRRSLKSEGDKEEARRKEEDKMKMKTEIDENVTGLNLSRVLMQRMMAKNGSKSAEGTPASVRRQKLMRELRETHIGNEKPNSRTMDKDLFLVDIEADKKYRELIKEAENIYESMQKSPIVQSRKIVEEKERKANQEVEPLEIWRKAETMCCSQYPLENSVRKSPKNLGLKLRVEETPKKLDFGKDKKSSFKAKSSAHSPLDPLGPTFRNFAVFKPVNIDDGKMSSTSSSDDSEPQKSHKRKTLDFPREPETLVTTPGSPIVPIAFQSIDLGKPLTTYCPQSEPVKRKIYSCSKTYDKLVKQFETKPKIFEENQNGTTRHGSLMTRRRTEMEEAKMASSSSATCRGLAKSERGNQGPGLKLQNEKRRREAPNGESLEKYFYNGVVYSPRLSPRRSSMPSAVASPNPSSQRHSYNMDAYR